MSRKKQTGEDEAEARKQRRALWFLRCMSGYFNSSIPDAKRNFESQPGLRRKEVAAKYNDAFTQFGLGKAGVGEENVRKWEQGFAPSKGGAIAFLLVFGLLDFPEAAASEAMKEVFSKFHEAYGLARRDRPFYLSQLERVPDAAVNHVGIGRHDTIGVYRGVYLGHTLQSFYAGLIAEAHRRSIQVISETGPEDPSPIAELDSFKNLLTRGVNAVVISHWRNRQDLSEEVKSLIRSSGAEGRAAPLVLFETEGFEAFDPHRVRIDHAGIVALLGDQLREWLKKNPVAGRKAKVAVLNDTRNYVPLQRRGTYWIAQEASLGELAEFEHVNCLVSNPIAFADDNAPIIENCLRVFAPDVVIGMWYEFSRVCLSVMTKVGMLKPPRIFTVDLTDHGFAQMRKPDTPIVAAVYFDAYETGRKCVGLLAQSLRGPDLLTDKPHDILPRVATTEELARSSVASVAEFYNLKAQAR